MISILLMNFFVRYRQLTWCDSIFLADLLELDDGVDGDGDDDEDNHEHNDDN